MSDKYRVEDLEKGILRKELRVKTYSKGVGVYVGVVGLVEGRILVKHH